MFFLRSRRVPFSSELSRVRLHPWSGFFFLFLVSPISKRYITFMSLYSAGSEFRDESHIEIITQHFLFVYQLTIRISFTRVDRNKKKKQ